MPSVSSPGSMLADRETAVVRDEYDFYQDQESWECLMSLLDKYRYVNMTKEEEITIGRNLYMIGNHLKRQNDVVVNTKTFSDGDMRDYLYRSQLQLAF